MSEPRKNRLTIDGGQVKEDEHISTYKVIPESDTDFRKSKSSLAKSREKVSSDGAEEKLLEKEEEVKITPRVDMDAKYVVESYTNGDAKIELDANKRQFTGLTKEELMKYADDPFWVRLRWFMFILFWALWLAMLAGAIVVIVKAPKCAAPTPKTWYEKGPLVEGSQPYTDIESTLSTLEAAGVQGIFAPLCSDDTYDISTSCFDDFKAFVAKAKEHSIKIIVDLTANFVSKSNKWFGLSENRTGNYDTYFIWHKGTEVDPSTGKPGVPNNWISTKNIPAWSWSDIRQEYYLHQYGEDQPDLNFTNPNVVREFNDVLVRLMGAGAGGIRLHNARLLLVNSQIVNASEEPNSGKGSALGVDHTSYQYLKHTHTSDQPGLKNLFANFSNVVDQHGPSPGSGETVFTIAEDGTPGVEMFLLDHKLSSLRPISSRPLHVTDLNVETVAADINKRLVNWTILQLTASEDVGEELATFAMLLPAAPVFVPQQLYHGGNSSLPNEGVRHLVSLRSDASIEHGNHSVRAVPADNGTEYVLACARWKPKHTGYVSLFNPHAVEVRANLTLFSSCMPAEGLSVHYAADANYKNAVSFNRNSVLVPPRSSVVLSYVPVAEGEATE